MRTFTLEKTIAAPPSTVFEVLADHRGYSAISPIRSSTLEREGDPAPNGVGAIRVLKTLGPPLREEIVEFVPGERLVYRLLSGAPLRDHTGTITLTEHTERHPRHLHDRHDADDPRYRPRRDADREDGGQAAIRRDCD